MSDVISYGCFCARYIDLVLTTTTAAGKLW